MARRQYQSRGGGRSSFVKHELLSNLVNELWDMDEDARCHHGEHYAINLQGYTGYSDEKDRAREKLFTWVDEDKLLERPTYKTFHALLDNYIAMGGEREVFTAKEMKENAEFIEACMATPVMQHAWEFLQKNKDITSNESKFIDLLHKTWFELFRRTKGDRDKDSSGFEHVFVGEIKKLAGGKLEVSGFHNWIQLYQSEKSGNLDYKGFYKRGTDKGEEEPRMLTLRFGWEGEDDENPDDDVEAIKSKGSSFLGTSPEFELALYTVCFFMGVENVSVILADKWKLVIKVHKMGPYLGSCYPMALGYV